MASIPTKKISFSELLGRGVDEVVIREHLESRLQKGEKLRIKHGIDPTGPRLHIGRAISLWKLRAFQELGHTVVLIIGDFTATIGDASDKTAKRKVLAPAEVKEHMKGYEAQLGKILDMKKVELRYNSEWLATLSQRELLKIATHFTARQFIHRRNFWERWEREDEIGLHELLYPVYQGYDSVAVRADVEIGGSDQLFNFTVARDIQALYGQAPQDFLTTKMLFGLDGEKMSTSAGNIVSILDEPADMYGKVMSMHDAMMPAYFELACPRLPLKEVAQLQSDMQKGALSPRDIKMRLAKEITSLYHEKKPAEDAEKRFVELFQKKTIPGDIPVLVLSGDPKDALELLILSKTVSSKAEAKRLIEQRGVEVDGTVLKDWKGKIAIHDGMVIRVGKRRFFRIKKA